MRTTKKINVARKHPAIVRTNAGRTTRNKIKEIDFTKIELPVLEEVEI